MSLSAGVFFLAAFCPRVRKQQRARATAQSLRFSNTLRAVFVDQAFDPTVCFVAPSGRKGIATTKIRVSPKMRSLRTLTGPKRGNQLPAILWLVRGNLNRPPFPKTGLGFFALRGNFKLMEPLLVRLGREVEGVYLAVKFPPSKQAVRIRFPLPAPLLSSMFCAHATTSQLDRM